jgi:DNA-binding MarR family transcriptional regulator
MDKLIEQEFFEDFKKLFPGMNLEMISTFARIMLTLHHLPILAESYFHKMGLTRGRFMVLIQLYQRGDEGMSIGDIRNFHKVRSATMTGIIDTLEKEGQIERISDPTDRRKVIVRITTPGQELIENFLPKHQEYINQMLSKLTKEEHRSLLNLLQKLYQGVYSTVETIPPIAKGKK